MKYIIQFLKLIDKKLVQPQTFSRMFYFNIFINNINCIVRRISINYNIFNVQIALADNAVNSFFKRFFTIKDDSDY